MSSELPGILPEMSLDVSEALCQLLQVGHQSRYLFVQLIAAERVRVSRGNHDDLPVDRGEFVQIVLGLLDLVYEITDYDLQLELMLALLKVKEILFAGFFVSKNLHLVVSRVWEGDRIHFTKWHFAINQDSAVGVESSQLILLGFDRYLVEA